jgi:2,3-bisphosphoglycerate-independent phosphoglycerate mutase
MGTKHADSRAVLIVLDGFGLGKDSPFNAIKNAKMPFYQALIQKYPPSQLLTHGKSVGLPDKTMGNSEVGHMAMGAGRVIYQDLTRISESIRTRDFFKNDCLRQTIQAGAEQTGRVHLMGLLSDAGVHSHMDHLLALLDLCMELKVPQVCVHPILDGRDTPPNSSPKFITRLLLHPSFVSGQAKIATLMGRFFAMDRDQRWERIEKAYRALTGQVSLPPSYLMKHSSSPLSLIESSYVAQGKGDEFVEPVLLEPSLAMQDGDSVVFFNYRSDRAREMSSALSNPEFAHFDRGRGFKPSAIAGMTVYDKSLTHMKVAYPPQSLKNIMGEWLEQKNLKQLRIAETEKYAHVTFFFNAGREIPFVGEERILIASARDVQTYDEKPEMSAFEVAREASAQIALQKYDFILMNFANADMVGHTGNYNATLKALEALDQCLAKVISTAEKSGYHVLLTADHGNAEEMLDPNGHHHTQHTLNPVPAIWVAPNTANAPQTSRLRLRDGALSDVMPTLCDLMNIDVPSEVTGKSLLSQL